MIGQPRQAILVNRRRHLRTVIRVNPSSAATRATPDPGSAHASTIPPAPARRTALRPADKLSTILRGQH